MRGSSTSHCLLLIWPRTAQGRLSISFPLLLRILVVSLLL